MNKSFTYCQKCMIASASITLTSTFAFADNTTLGTDAGANLTASADANTLIGHSAGNAMTFSDYNTFIGNQAGMANTGNDNVFLGYQSGLVNISCFDNTFVGYQSGLANCSASTGSDNSFFGYRSGLKNTEGNDNTFFGYIAGYENTTGDENVMFGYAAGKGINESDRNTGVGYGSMRSGTVTGSGNAFLGHYAGFDITSGTHNTQIGYNIYQLDEGNFNTSIGFESGFHTEFGDYNTFVGASSGYQNDVISTADDTHFNTAFGAGALYNNREGQNNLFIGASADTYNASNIVTDGSVGIGYSVDGAETGSVALGAYAGALGDNIIAIGASADVDDNKSIGIGFDVDSASNKTVTIGGANTLSWDSAVDATNSLGDTAYRFSNLISASINSVANANTSTAWTIQADAAEDDGDSWQVEVSEGGQITFANDVSGSQVANLTLNGDGDLSVGGELYLNSDKRLKHNIQPIKNSLNLTKKVQAVHYHFAGDDDNSLKHLGLIAQQVETVIPNMVKTDETGRKTVNYIALVPLLVESIKTLDNQNKSNQELLKQLKARKVNLEKLIASRTTNQFTSKEALIHEAP